MRTLTVALLLALTLAALPGYAMAEPDPVAGPVEREELRYRWRLGRNLVGLLARLFVPSLPDEGEGRLTLEPAGLGTFDSELLITSQAEHEGDYWRYGARIQPASRTALAAWSSYRWRGEEKSKRDKIEQEGVLDVASAIYWLRRDPPQQPRHLEIWSDGKIYPVVVIPRGQEERTLGEVKVNTRHLAIRGMEVSGKRYWKGKLDLWLAFDAALTPVEITIERSMAKVRLELITDQIPGDGVPGGSSEEDP